MSEKAKKYSFEEMIIQCCKSDEFKLRKWIKKVLTRSGFSIQEDNYESDRRGQYSGIHNLLAIRGKNAKVCLVAHTDVCRDHRGGPSIAPEPVIKVDEFGGKRIIQDKTCKTQVGGDDRLGVAINMWIALNTGYDMGMLFTTDEEVGIVSAQRVRFPELMEFELLCQVDRGRHSRQIVTNIGGLELCNEEVAEKLIKISEEMGIPRYQISGLITDVYAIRRNKMCKQAINLTCGYYSAENRDEWICIEEARDTVKFVSSIIQKYDIGEVLIAEKLCA